MFPPSTRNTHSFGKSWQRKMFICENVNKKCASFFKAFFKLWKCFWKVPKTVEPKVCITRVTGSRSTFKFLSRVNLSGPSLYCIARSLGKERRHLIGLVGATSLTGSDIRLNLLLLKGQGCVVWQIQKLKEFTLSNKFLTLFSQKIKIKIKI